MSKKGEDLTNQQTQSASPAELRLVIGSNREYLADAH